MAAAAAASTVTEDEKAWEEMLRKMLPPGAPLPDEEHLDYSIAVEYDGPPIPYDLPRVDPVDPQSLAARSASSSSPASVVADDSARRGGPRRGWRQSRGSRSPAESARSSSAVQSKRHEVGVSDGEEASSPRTSSVLDQSSPSISPRGPAAPDGRRAVMVTFNTVEESERDEEEVSGSIGWSGTMRPGRAKEGKRGVCCRCGKGNILKEREACLVCDARYCSNCVLKAMGSMPEGRKCVSCIGRPIDESKRSTLGRSSRMLCRLCSPLEVRQIMKAERECPANQLRPEQLLVNGRPLRQEELDEILGCPNPPQRLKPGRYWYDKDSGLWGKVRVEPLYFL